VRRAVALLPPCSRRRHPAGSDLWRASRQLRSVAVLSEAPRGAEHSNVESVRPRRAERALVGTTGWLERTAQRSTAEHTDSERRAGDSTATASGPLPGRRE